MTTRGGITGRRTARLEGLSAVSGDAATAQTRAEDSAGRAGGTGAEGGAGTARELTGDEGGRRERELCVTTLTRRGEDGDSGGPQYHCTKKREQHVLDSVTKLLGDDDPFAQGYLGIPRALLGRPRVHHFLARHLAGCGWLALAQPIASWLSRAAPRFCLDLKFTYCFCAHMHEIVKIFTFH